MHLKSFLRDEPLKLIDDLLSLLKKQYENKLSVINAYMTSFL